MAKIKPFAALKPRPGLEQKIASPPYDVLNSMEARELAKNNPHSFLHITKAEIGLPPDIDTHSQEVYQKASENLQQLIQQGWLLQEDKECYYIYSLTMNGKSQTGLVCVSAVEDYFNDTIKKHEFTRPEKEKDRIDHMKTIKAQTGNVFLAYKNVKNLDEILHTWMQTNTPYYNFTADDDISHTIWIINNETTIEAITKIFAEEVAATYIADGHHRAASAAKVSTELPNSPYTQYFLTTIFPASELAIMDYNRVIKDLNGLSPNEFISLLEPNFIITESNNSVKPASLHEFGMYLDNKWYILKAKEGTYTTDPIGVLDISILTENILKKHLGILDQRTDQRIDFVGGIRGIGELEKRVNTGEMQLAFSLYPVSIQQLFDIADSGNVMPPKSTWFEPKLRDGLLTHLL